WPGGGGAGRRAGGWCGGGGGALGAPAVDRDAFGPLHHLDLPTAVVVSGQPPADIVGPAAPSRPPARGSTRAGRDARRRLHRSRLAAGAGTRRPPRAHSPRARGIGAIPLRPGPAESPRAARLARTRAPLPILRRGDETRPA